MTVMSVISGQLQNPIAVDITTENLEFYGPEGNVEDDYIKDEIPTFISHTDKIIDREILKHLHGEIPLNDFPANHCINDYIAAVQLITLSRNTMQSCKICKIALCRGIIKLDKNCNSVFAKILAH